MCPIPCLSRLSQYVAGLAVAILGLLTPQAAARCGGTDLMAALALADPAAHAAILERADRVPNGHGIFWQVRVPQTAPGTEAVPASYLYGTLHSTEAAARWLPKPAIDALGGARLVMVELTEAEQARLRERLRNDPDFSIDHDGPRLSDRLSADQLARAARILAERGLPLELADKLEPWLLISAIAVPMCERAELAIGKKVLDDAIAAEATAWGIPIAGLETFEQTFAAFDALTDREMTALLADGFANTAREEDLRRTLETLYQQGQVAAIMEFNIWHTGQVGMMEDARAGAQALSRALIATRNHNWLGALVPELRRGGVFAAFGALHLPGPDGLVELLRARGFEVVRIGG
ncbi:MAG: TraB/GumN family protein [Pikeienuella sp.]